MDVTDDAPAEVSTEEAGLKMDAPQQAEVATTEEISQPGCEDECGTGKVGCLFDARVPCGDFDEDSCLEWGPVDPCPEGKECVLGECVCVVDCQGKDCGPNGCGGECGLCAELEKCVSGECVSECEFGECGPEDNPAWVCGGKELKFCELWACDLGCCQVEELEGLCCHEDADCKDCYLVEDGTIVPCPWGIGPGQYPNECTEDICITETGWCLHLDKAEEGLCDDGNPCTDDTCNPIIGDCYSLPSDDYLDCLTVPCWGATTEEADEKCSDDNACTSQSCQFEKGFVSWTEPGDPEVSDPDNLPEGVGLCEFVDLTPGCNGGDSCMTYGCEPDVGCVWECNENPPDGWDCGYCYCSPLWDDSNPCTIPMYFSDSGSCGFLPADCDDGNPCTTDSCDETAEESTYPCVHVPDDSAECDDFDPETVNGCFAGECVCVPQCDEKECGDDGCGGICGVCDDEDPCTVDACTGNWCEHDKITGCCSSDSQCEDGIECTLNYCSNSVCVKSLLTGQTPACCWTIFQCDEIPGMVAVCVGNQCVHVPLSDYCSSDDECDDDSPCTDDLCGPGFSCQFVDNGSYNCCDQHQDCMPGGEWDDGVPSTTDVCDENQCVHFVLPGYCDDSGYFQCLPDDNICTNDYCDLVENTCHYECVPGCCAVGNCTDGDVCTEDTCDCYGCQHVPIEGCCNSDLDCEGGAICSNYHCTCDNEQCEGLCCEEGEVCYFKNKWLGGPKECCLPDCPEYGVDDGCGEFCLGGGYLPLEADVELCCYYKMMGTCFDAVPAGGGLQVDVAGNEVTVTWVGVLYEECAVPESFHLTTQGGQLLLELVDLGCNPVVEPALTCPPKCLCCDDNCVGDFTTSFELEPGEYELTVKCELTWLTENGGIWPNMCGQPETFQISVPGP